MFFLLICAIFTVIRCAADNKLSTCRPCAFRLNKEAIYNSISPYVSDKDALVPCKERYLYPMQITRVDYIEPKWYICCKCLVQVLETPIYRWVLASSREGLGMLVVSDNKGFLDRIGIEDGHILSVFPNKKTGNLDFLVNSGETGCLEGGISSHKIHCAQYKNAIIRGMFMGAGFVLEWRYLLKRTTGLSKALALEGKDPSLPFDGLIGSKKVSNSDYFLEPIQMIRLQEEYKAS